MHVKCTYNGVPLSEREFPKKLANRGYSNKDTISISSEALAQIKDQIFS
ncbi:unnamed protein product [Linum tenue]|uniref:Uncharacterized protein n=1 Tax=Linum tenue TaxID=586396 RepID=A0AAV0LF53_9ROSI|nr:unnamed protein product [Linum tenue]